MNMLIAGTSLANRTPFEILTTDMKEFSMNGIHMAIAQINTVDVAGVLSKQLDLEKTMKEINKNATPPPPLPAPPAPRRLTGVPFHQKKPNQPHPAANSAQPIHLQTHSPSTQASSFPVKTLLKKWITGPSPKAVTSVPIPTTPPVR